MVFGQGLTTASDQGADISYLKICQWASYTEPKYLEGTLSGRSFTFTTLYPTLIVISLPFRRPVKLWMLRLHYFGKFEFQEGKTQVVTHQSCESQRKFVGFLIQQII